MPPLTNARHEAFARALFEGETADAAFVKAGYSKNRGNASRLKANENVLRRVSELQSEAARSSQVTVASLLGELEEARQKATSLSQLSAVVRAVEAKARVSGLLVQRIEVKSLDERFEDAATQEDIIRRMAVEYRREGYPLDDGKDMDYLRAFMTRWWGELDAFLASVKARPVQQISPNQEHIERRRLGMLRTNGAQRKV